MGAVKYFSVCLLVLGRETAPFVPTANRNVFCVCQGEDFVCYLKWYGIACNVLQQVWGASKSFSCWIYSSRSSRSFFVSRCMVSGWIVCFCCVTSCVMLIKNIVMNMTQVTEARQTDKTVSVWGPIVHTVNWPSASRHFSRFGKHTMRWQNRRPHLPLWKRSLAGAIVFWWKRSIAQWSVRPASNGEGRSLIQPISTVEGHEWFPILHECTETSKTKSLLHLLDSNCSCKRRFLGNIWPAIW